MYSLNFAFSDKTKKITLPKNINTENLALLIAQSFNLNEKVISLTNSKGQLISLQQLQKSTSKFQGDLLFLVTIQDMNEDNMSFGNQLFLQEASDRYDKGNQKKNKKQPIACQTSQIPQKLQGFYQGVIGDLQIFEELFLQENEVTIVFCFVKEKPKNIQYPYYLYHTAKNSAIVYLGLNRICQFFIDNMESIPIEIENFIRTLLTPKIQSQLNIDKAFAKNKSKSQSKRQSKSQSENLNKIEHQSRSNKQMLFNDQQKLGQLNDDLLLHGEEPEEALNILNQEDDQEIAADQQSQLIREEEERKDQDIKDSLLQNLLKLRDDEEITELEFYRMKSELLQNISDFMRKYQMGTRKGRRKQMSRSKQGTDDFAKNEKLRRRNRKEEKGVSSEKQEQQRMERIERIESKNQLRNTYSRDQRRTKKYEIPIIVRKYNNVIQKISTSYPLTQEQQQSINLILQLQLKGLISQKQSGIYKSSILQEDPDVFPLFLDYFDGLSDQLELVSRLKKIKRVNSQKKERSEHNMRLLIKYAKQPHYELLKNLMLDKNQHVLSALQKFRQDKHTEKLKSRLERIATFYRQKNELDDDIFE